MRVRTFVGLDVHRNLVVGTALNAAGKHIRQSTFGPGPKEVARFLRGLPRPIKVVMEATSVWERYYEAAKSSGAEVVLSHPRTTRMIAEASLKTDKVDSAALANLLRLDSLPLVYIPSPEIRALRKLYLDRRFYTRTRTSIAQHAYARLGQHGIEYKHNALQRRSGRDQFRPLGIPEVTLALDAVDDFEKHSRELDSRIHEAFVASPEAQLLRTIPGIGESSAVGIAGYICPIERFPSAAKLSSYAGLCPTTHQSSDTLFHGHLKPDCSRGFRGLLIEASWRHRIHEPAGDVAKCAERVARAKGRMHGTIAGAHKLVRIIYAILKQRRPYLHRAPEALVSHRHPGKTRLRATPLIGTGKPSSERPSWVKGIASTRAKRMRVRAGLALRPQARAEPLAKRPREKSHGRSLQDSIEPAAKPMGMGTARNKRNNRLGVAA